MIDAATPESDKLANRLSGLCRPPGEASEPDGVGGLARWLCANYSLYWRREDLHDPGANLPLSMSMRCSPLCPTHLHQHQTHDALS